MTFRLSELSRNRLKGVHNDLVRVVEKAITLTKVDFAVTEGLRTLTRQRQLWHEGKTKTMNSRHLTGHAVDLATIINGELDFNNRLPYDNVAWALAKASEELLVPIRWGGTWSTLNSVDGFRARRNGFVDVFHFELPRGHYPA
jgi:peptidoglycan LD-endopeptidase CwlK